MHKTCHNAIFNFIKDNSLLVVSFLDYKHIPALKPKSRDREYKKFPESIRDRVIYGYLFDGLSHRQLDESELGQSSEYSRGYFSMGILHHLGIVGSHKGIFASTSVKEALELLKSNGNEFNTIVEAIQRYTSGSETISTKEIDYETILKDIESDVVENGEFPKKYEGTARTYFGKRYERDPENRRRAIELHGISCQVCGFNFEEVYGERGKDFIEVHHMKPLSTFGGESVEIDPQTDLIPLCSNCHRMIHRRIDDVLTVEQLKQILQQGRRLE